MATWSKAKSRLLKLRSQVDYALTDHSPLILKRSERAFLHLRQCIVASPDFRAEWRAAFEHHETACEKLGAAHLLLHGVYAFKAVGPMAATDLVFNEPVDLTEAGTVADALVLTEWKRVADPSTARSLAATAHRQAGIYESGVLGGLELTSYRYLILVSLHPLTNVEMPHDFVEGRVTYRHINIPVEPLPPSQTAKRS